MLCFGGTFAAAGSAVLSWGGSLILGGGRKEILSWRCDSRPMGSAY